MKKTYLNATEEAGKAFYQRDIPGQVVMLNLLRFRKTADYHSASNLSPSSPISGEEAYQRYMDEALPLLKKIGSDILFFGQGGYFLFGPETERWDKVLLVRHQSVKMFMGLAGDAVYQQIAGHRTAALQDSRLLPIEEDNSWF